MSSIAKVLFGALLVLVAGAAVISLLAVVIGWLLPIATLGAFAPGFIPCVAILTLVFILRGTVQVKTN
jgi:hypothetical protein